MSNSTSIENYPPQTLKTFTIHVTVKLCENTKIIKKLLNVNATIIETKK